MNIEKLEPFAIGYKNAEKDDVGYRIACGFKKFAENIDISINPEEWFVGLKGSWGNTSIRYSRGDGISARVDRHKKQLEKYPELTEEINSLYDYFYPLDLEKHFDLLSNDLERELNLNKCCWGAGGGHSNPDYEMLLRLGTTGLKQKIERFKKVHTDKTVFYEGLTISLEAVEILALRYKELAEQLLSGADGNDKIILSRQIKALENVPQNKPRDFFEACLMFWLTFTFLDVDSPGLFDYILGEYYQTHDKADRFDCLKKLWELFKETRTWNLCISGSDEFGNVFVNDLTHDVLKVARECKYNTPNITMRMCENTPDELWLEAVETLATGIGMPAIYNDDCVCTALEALGIPSGDAHKYCMNGCNQIDIFGKSHMGLEDGEISIIKCLEFALFNGVCKYSNKKLGLETGNPEDFADFNEFLNAYKKQAEFVADIIVNISNRCQREFAKIAPHPWRSALTQGCIEKGLDMKNKGPIYGHGQVLTEGLPDTADCLAAIKHFIYDTKKYTMKELTEALDQDFEGFEELYNDFSSHKKFGNDIDEVDEIYADITDHIYRYFQTKQTFRGGVFGVGCSTYHRAPNYGLHCGALPNGKKKGETTLADSIGATPGRDVSGPTALLNSVLKGNQYLATSGNVMQIKFSKSQFNTTAGKAAFIALAKTYFKLGGQTLQINVLSKEELLDALLHPDKHENLIVRVGGFSEYFNKLPPALQESVIKRTENIM